VTVRHDCNSESYQCVSVGAPGGVPLAEVDVGLLADEVGKATPDALDGSQGVHDLVAPVHVRVQHTQDVLEPLVHHQSLHTAIQ